MLKRTITISAIALLCAMPAMAKDMAKDMGTAASHGVQIAQAQYAGADVKKLIGRHIQNTQGETIGDIESVYVDGTGKVDLVLVGVGGFLGLGERVVAISWKDLQVSQNGEKVVVNMTKDQLKAMPEYRYADTKYRGTVFGDSRPVPVDRTMPPSSTTPPAAQPDRPRMASGDYNAAGNVAASALVGATVKNQQNETIGTIDEVYVDAAGTAKSVVISVGGFLGVGARHVAMSWSDLQLQRDKNSLVVRINATKDSLKALPEYKYDRR